MAKVMIVRPEGMEMPEDVEVGEPFDVLAKVCFRDNGKLEIKSIDGIEFGDYGDESEEEYDDMDTESEMDGEEEDALVVAMKGMGRA